jgi:hypothetical protein
MVADLMLDEAPPPRRHWFARLIMPDESGRSGSLSVGLAALGAAAFLASVVLDWQLIAIRSTQPTEADNPDAAAAAATSTAAGISDVTTYGTVYVVGMLALLVLAGAAASRADLAARLRLGVLGGAAGLMAVLVAITVRVPTTIMGVSSALQSLFPEAFGIANSDRYDVSYGPGIFAAYLAVIAPTVAIWAAARAGGMPRLLASYPAEGARPGRQRRYQERATEVDHSGDGADGAHAGVVGPAALPEYQTQSVQGPIDLTVTPG